MQKYHVLIGFKDIHVKEAKDLILRLQARKRGFSFHALQELSKEIEAVKIGRVLKDYSLDFKDCFEIAVLNGRIEKLGFRVKNGYFDVIFILSSANNIITLWVNEGKDNHISLNPAKYCNV